MDTIASKCFALVSGILLSATAMIAQNRIDRVEPLSWWTGMKTELQLLVQGPGIGQAEVSMEGAPGVWVKAVHKADSPNYLFVDVEVEPVAKPGEYTLVFRKDGETLRYPYQIKARAEGSAERTSFTTADLIYLIMPDRFADGDPSIDSTPDTAEGVDRSQPGARHGGDIQGIIDHLDYIADLGATAIWNTPLLCDDDRRGSYHGYACSDYYHIDPRYGSNEKYRELVEKHGMLMDEGFDWEPGKEWFPFLQDQRMPEPSGPAVTIGEGMNEFKFIVEDTSADQRMQGRTSEPVKQLLHNLRYISCGRSGVD